MSYVYLGAIACGVVLLVANMIHGGKDHIGHFSIRFWTFMLAFGGAVGYALERAGESNTISAAGALGVGAISGTMAVLIIRTLAKKSAGSEVTASELVGTTGQLVLPAGPSKPGKVRVDVKGRIVDYIANVVDDAGDLPTGTQVLIVAEGDRGSLLVTKHEV
jgi:membrane protein implicated in regulation of membrane protease activity